MFISRPSTKQWSSILGISTTFSDGMVIDLRMFILRPSVKQWSSILGISRPSSMKWSLISYVYMKALSDGMVIDFLRIGVSV